MRAILVWFSLVLAVTAMPRQPYHHQGEEGDDSCASDSPEYKKITRQIGHLTADFIAFENSIKEAAEMGKDMDDDIREITTRIEAFSGSGCDDRKELQCGGKSPKCVSRLLVCDEKEDCPNGEDEAQCRVLVPAGSKWLGTYSFDHCTRRKPDHFDLIIESYKVVDFLKPFPEVHAFMDIEKETDEFDASVHLDLHGVMDLKPGNHILYFTPPEIDGLAVTCTFDGVHDDHCHGAIVHEASQTPCAEFYLERVE